MCVNGKCTVFIHKSNCHEHLKPYEAAHRMKGRGQLLYLFATGLLLKLTAHVTAIPLNEFYPYGIEAGDSLANRTLDGSAPPIILPLEFPFFGKSFNTIFVSQTDYSFMYYCGDI